MNLHTIPRVIITTHENLTDLDVPGRWIAILDIPFALPVAPAGQPLSHPETQAYYQQVFQATTLAFIRRLGERLAVWIDHHDHAAWTQFRNNPKFLLIPQARAPACALLVKPELFLEDELARVDTIVCHGDLDGLISAARFVLHGSPPYADALADAVSADTRQGELSDTGRLLDRAIKARPDEATRRSALDWLLDHDEQAFDSLKNAEALFPGNALDSARFQEIGGCRILDTRNLDVCHDMTQTLCDLQEGDKVGIVIHRQGKDERISIAGHREGIDLPRLLDLPGGSPFRVCLGAGHLAEAVTRINSGVFDEKIRLDLPREATIEITRRCNLLCALCPVGNGQARRMPDMGFDTFSRIIDLFGPSLESICLHNYGEPLLHPSLGRFIRHSKASGIRYVFLTVNGNYLPLSLAQELVASGLDCIRFSVDTSNPGAYAQYRTGGDLTRVLKNMNLLRKTREGLGGNLPIIEAQALLMRQNEAFIDDFERVMRENGADRVRYKTVNIFMSGEEHQDRGKDYLPDSPDYSRYSTQSPKCATEEEVLKACPLPWEQVVVLVDGTLVPCCYDFNGKHPLGKINRKGETFSIWDSPERRTFMLQRILRPTSIEMCRRCSYAVPGMDVHKLVTPRPEENLRE